MGRTIHGFMDFVETYTAAIPEPQVHIKFAIWDRAVHSDLGEYCCNSNKITFCVFVLQHCRVSTDNGNAHPAVQQ